MLTFCAISGITIDGFDACSCPQCRPPVAVAVPVVTVCTSRDTLASVLADAWKSDRREQLLVIKRSTISNQRGKAC